jgi:hypothetical protein
MPNMLVRVGWFSNEVHGSYGVSLWKNIRRGWESFLIIPDLRWEMVTKLDQVLKDIFLDLFRMGCVKDAFVAKYLELTSDTHKWNVSFIRDAHDWEVDVFA